MNFPYNTSLCSVANPEVINHSMSLFPDGNLMMVNRYNNFRYRYRVTNTFFDNNIRFVNVLSKIEESSGKTIWATAFLTEYQMMNMEMSISFGVLGSYYGGFIRFNSNGNRDLLKIFSSNNKSYQAIYFESLHLLSYLNSNIILNGVVINTSSKIGYSDNSSTDQAIFRIDQNGATLWTTVLDYNSGNDLVSGLISYDSYIYVGMFGDNLYP